MRTDSVMPDSRYAACISAEQPRFEPRRRVRRQILEHYPRVRELADERRIMHERRHDARRGTDGSAGVEQMRQQAVAQHVSRRSHRAEPKRGDQRRYGRSSMGRRGRRLPTMLEPDGSDTRPSSSSPQVSTPPPGAADREARPAVTWSYAPQLLVVRDRQPQRRTAAGAAAAVEPALDRRRCRSSPRARRRTRRSRRDDQPACPRRRSPPGTPASRPRRSAR